MDIIDIAIAKSKATAIDPSDISSAVSDYLDEHGVQVETDTTLSVAGASADSTAVDTNRSTLLKAMSRTVLTSLIYKTRIVTFSMRSTAELLRALRRHHRRNMITSML